MSKIWFITGISSGLGKAITEAVINEGDFVIGTLRSAEAVEKFNARYKERARAVHVDITNHQAMEEIIASIPRIDVLVNNAGIGFVGAIEETSLEESRKVFEVNFFASLNLTQLVLPKMRQQEQGHILQISSHGGIKAFAGFGMYNASKFALEGFSEALAQEVKPLGITVTLVEPGPFRTEFASKELPEAKKVIYDYAETAGTFRNKLKGVHGKQEGDPVKAAKAILSYVAKENTPLRLPLGKVPLKTIQMKLDEVQNDLEINSAVAAEVTFN